MSPIDTNYTMWHLDSLDLVQPITLKKHAEFCTQISSFKLLKTEDEHINAQLNLSCFFPEILDYQVAEVNKEVI